MSKRERIDEWNRRYPIGTPVTMLNDAGRREQLKTRSQAQMLGNTPVIWLEGIPGCYALSRVSPVDVAAVRASALGALTPAGRIN